MKRPLIRLCGPDDLRSLEWDGLFTHHREIIERTFGEQQAGHQIMLVAEIDGKPRGQAWIDLRRAHARSAGVVWAVRVHPCERGRGLGTRLLRAAEHVVRRRGLAAVELRVEVTNERAYRFYRSLGYVPMRQCVETYGYTTPAGAFRQHTLELLEMRKELIS